MEWVELIGPHGVGKTSIRKGLRRFCPPRAPALERANLNQAVYGINYTRPTLWNVPKRWRPLLGCVEKLYGTIPDIEAYRLRQRRFCKGVFRMVAIDTDPRPACEVREIIGCEGMRLSFSLPKPMEIRSYFEAMPVSIGVVVLYADVDTIVQRNQDRPRHRGDFGRFAELGAVICELAAEILAKRTRVLHLDATQPIEASVQRIVEFGGLSEYVK
jgi:hypothetical protein